MTRFLSFGTLEIKMLGACLLRIFSMVISNDHRWIFEFFTGPKDEGVICIVEVIHGWCLTRN